jgi:hypothetical protein
MRSRRRNLPKRRLIGLTKEAGMTDADAALFWNPYPELGTLRKVEDRMSEPRCRWASGKDGFACWSPYQVNGQIEWRWSTQPTENDSQAVAAACNEIEAWLVDRE